jgi:preprotein translocase subunit YajC
MRKMSLLYYQITRIIEYGNYPDRTREDFKMNQMKRTCVWVAMLTVVLAMAASAVAQDKKDTGGGFPEAAPAKKAAPAQPAGDAGSGFPAGKTEAKGAEGAAGKDATTQPADDKPGQKKPGFLDSPMIWVLGGGLVLMWIFMGRSRKKQERKRKEMIASLEKGDKVITIGGIVGTIVEARETEIVIKVNDSSRMTFARWSVRNAGEDVKADKKEDSQEQK